MFVSMRHVRPILALLAASTLASSVTTLPPAAVAADVAQGARLAERWCASCHAIKSGQPAASSDAPSFAAINAARKVPEITAFLSQSHSRMPDMALSRNEISDLIAYMQSLGPPLDPQKPELQKDNPPKQFRG